MDQIMSQAASTVFALLQVGIVAAVSGMWKLWSDVQRLKGDMDAAHKKIRDFEQRGMQ
jgi:hypothetical protein